jgi:hypothetical protein
LPFPLAGLSFFIALGASNRNEKWQMANEPQQLLRRNFAFVLNEPKCPFSLFTCHFLLSTDL